MKWLASCFVTTTLLLGAPLALADRDLIGQITRLYRAGQIDEAYKLARKHLPEARGDPVFDYHYALAAIDSGHIRQGLIALERLLRHQPDHLGARLELARGHFLLEQYGRARLEFHQALASNPPAEVAASIHRFIQAIQRRESGGRTTADLYLELGLGYDSNIGSAPSAAGYTSRLGTGTLDEASLAIDGHYYRLAGGVTIDHPLRAGATLFGSLHLHQRRHETTRRFDTDTLDLQGGLLLPIGPGYLKAGIAWQRYAIGHARYYESSAVNGELGWQPAPETRLAGFLQAAKIRFFAEGYPDSRQQTAGASLQHRLAIPLHPTVFCTLYGGTERANSGRSPTRFRVDRAILGIHIGSRLAIGPGFSLDLMIQRQQSRYREKDPFFLENRTDEYRNYSLGVGYRLDRRWSLHATLDYTEGRSNLALYRYYRTQAGISVRYEY